MCCHICLPWRIVNHLMDILKDAINFWWLSVTSRAAQVKALISDSIYNLSHHCPQDKLKLKQLKLLERSLISCETWFFLNSTSRTTDRGIEERQGKKQVPLYLKWLFSSPLAIIVLLANTVSLLIPIWQPTK